MKSSFTATLLVANSISIDEAARTCRSERLDAPAAVTLFL